MKASPVSIPAVALSGLLALSGLACAPESTDSDVPSVHVDHVIVAIDDLERGVDRFEELTGIRPIFGGEHPGRGTRNALVSLGPNTYLELLAPQAEAEVIEDAPGLAGLAEITGWGWAASTTDLDGTLARLRSAGFEVSETVAGSRATPDGGILRWTTASVVEPRVLGAPFFIVWDADSPHPATTSPSGCTLEALRVLSPDAEELKRFAQLLDLPVEAEAVDDSTERYEVTLQCPTGMVTFPGTAL